MRVLLVEPPKQVWEMMGDCVAPPQGLLSVAAVLEEERIPVTILDCNASQCAWSDVGDFIEEAEPDMVGASAMTPFFSPAARVMSLAKAIDPKVVTVLGGSHVTFLPQETLLNRPEIDFVVRGEGERTLVNLIRCLEEDDDLSRVEGIAFRQGDQVVQTPLPPPLDLDTLPLPAYHLVPTERYHFEFLGKFATPEASRGCPHRCTFCSEWRFWGEGWRPRNPEMVVEELELLHRKYGRESFWFTDDCFNVDGDHMRAICEGILARGLRISWFYQGRADLLMKYADLLPLMRESGNLMTQLGIEASTDSELDSLHKRLTVEEIETAVRLLKENDIVCQGLFITGTKTDDGPSIVHKLRFAKWLDVDFPIFAVYTPFPGSDVYEEARREGLLEGLEYSEYDMSHALLPTEHLSREESLDWNQWCFANYYLDPAKLVKGLFSRNSWKRRIWQHMLRFTGKQIFRSLF